MESAELEEFCFICNSNNKDATILQSLLSQDSPSKRNGDETAANLEEHLSVILLLRKVLCLRQAFLVSVLESSGKDPSSWNIKLCRMCHRIFGEASFVWSRLKKLHEEFENISEILRCKLVHNIRKSPPNEEDKFQVDKNKKEADKRGRGRLGRKRAKISDSSNVSDSCEDSQGIVDAIRQEFLRTHKGVKKVRFHDDSTGRECDSDAKVKNTNASKTKRRKLPEDDTNYFDAKSPRTQSLPTKRDSNFEDNEVSNEDFNLDDNNESFDDMDVDASQSRSSSPEAEPKDIKKSTDKDSDGDFDPETYHSNEEPDSLAEDSDFELSNADSSKTADGKRRCRKNPFVNGERGVIHKAIKSKTGGTFECSKCQKKGFATSTACDEHILRIHYGGKWPQDYACPVCLDRSFKGENWLRYHMKMRHPGAKLPSDELLERCIKEGTITQLTYEVVPYGQVQSTPTPPEPSKDLETEAAHANIKTEPTDPDEPEDFVTLDEVIKGDPAELKRIPVRMINGSMRYIPVPPEFFQLPEEVVVKFKESTEEITCELCDKKFPTEIQFESHVKRSHEGEKYPYACPMCPKKFERIGHMIIHHMLITHVPGRFHCDRCGNMFKEAILLNAHIQRNHLGIEHPYQCIKCGIRHPRRASLNKHLKRVHKLQLKCYTPERKGGMIRKPAKKKPKRQLKYPCDECSTEFQRAVKFATMEELDVHQKRQHLGISRPYPCTICKKKYSRPSLLDDHMRTHTVRSDLEVDEDDIEPPAIYVCGPCNKEFKTKSQFETHNQGRNHKNFRPYVCELCCQTFRGLRYLHHHQEQKHHEELNLKPSKCKYCGKILSSPRTLDDHVRIKHTKNAKFKCPHCDTHFQFEANMERHINVRHTRTTEYLCPHCPKSFPHNQYLQNHLRIHTGEKPYECKECSKRFADRSTYNRHVEAHGGKIHECPECKKSGFKTRHALGVHMKIHLGIKRNSRNKDHGVGNESNQFYRAPPEGNNVSNDNSSFKGSEGPVSDNMQAPKLSVSEEQGMAQTSTSVDTMPTLYPSFKVDQNIFL
ncbi:unnamed protein product [Orchesella dallaii]|uniref:C2H2-type domain-containing protein n=1 Tax=Orchesella dallaii TaxID=48710 RepID=A0ABP1S2Y3_9HEXA